MPHPRKTSAPPKDAPSYRHPEADLPARPELGVAGTCLQATMDLQMGDLLKNMRSSQIISGCGLPEVREVRGSWSAAGGRTRGRAPHPEPRTPNPEPWRVAVTVIDPRGSKLLVLKKLEER